MQVLQQGLAQTRRDYMRIQHENSRLPAVATATAEARKLIGLDQWAPGELGAEHIISPLSAKQLGLWNDYPELDATSFPHRHVDEEREAGAVFCARLPLLLVLGSLGAAASWATLSASMYESFM